MAKHKIGLVLGGGGAKGAYQAGVLKALQEANLLKDIRYVSANSIGTINALMFMSDKIEETYSIWQKINRKDALSFRRKEEKQSNEKFGIFSRKKLIALLKENVDFEKVSHSSRKLWITAFNKESKEIEYFDCSNKTSEEIISYALASSAIPYLYAPIQIQQKFYHDGYKDNVPVSILKKMGCDILLIIGLNPSFVPKDKDLMGIKVIDFTPPFVLGTSRFSALDFKEHNIAFRIQNGYEVAKKIIAENSLDIDSPFYRKNTFFSKLKRKIFRNEYNFKGNPQFYYRLQSFQTIGALNKDEQSKNR